MGFADKKMEREVREFKEEVENWMRREKRKREEMERKLQDVMEDMERMKGKMKGWQREMDELRDELAEKQGESKVRGKRMIVRRAKKIGESCGVKIVREKKEEGQDRTRESRCKVWERGLIVHTNNWTEEDSLEDWLEDIMEGVEWELEATRSEDTKKVIFKNKRDMERIWEKRAEVKEGGKIRLEQWLSHEERRAKRLIMREKRKREETDGGEASDIIIAEVDGERYTWDEEKERVIKKRKEKTQEEQKYERRRGGTNTESGEEEE